MMFEEEVGPMGQRPQLFWNLLVGHGAHLTPNDLEELTYYQLFGVVVGTRESFGGE
jgi:hypothetical protein